MNKALLLISVIIIVISSILLYMLKPIEETESQIDSKHKITIWGYSSTFLQIAKRFEEVDNDIGVVTKQFNTPQILLEELQIAQLAGTQPDMAEISSLYGMSEFIEKDALYPVDAFMDKEFAINLVKPFAKRFQYGDKMWALPLGYRIPLLYVNESMLHSDGNVHKEYANFNEVLTAAEKLQRNSQDIWGLNSDSQFPWYIQSLITETEAKSVDLKNSVWGKAKIEYQLIPSYTYHLALTQFVNGKGGILISSSEKLPFINKLIGSKFQWAPYAFPTETNSLVINGSGLVAFKKQDKKNEETIKKLFGYFQGEQQLNEISKNETYIPPIKKLISTSEFQMYYRKYPGYQSGIQRSLEASGKSLDSDDERQWNILIELDKSIQ